MDPQGYEVIPISAPNDVEKAHHYLWRLTEFPKAGHVTIFDRSQYGRVLVERVEGFALRLNGSRLIRKLMRWRRTLITWYRLDKVLGTN